MRSKHKGYSVFFCISTMLISYKHNIEAMHVSVQKLSDLGMADPYQNPCPYYVRTNIGDKRFFEVKSFSPVPYILHKKGYCCNGHVGSILYPAINAAIPILMSEAERAENQNDGILAWHYLRSARFLEAYQDATCMHMSATASGIDRQLDSLQTMVQLFPKIDKTISMQFYCSDAFKDALFLLSNYAMSGNERARNIFFAGLDTMLACPHVRYLLPCFIQPGNERLESYLKKAANAKNRSACTILGIMASERADHKQAFKYLQYCTNESAAPYAYYFFANLFRKGLGTNIDYGSAVRYFVKAISSGADQELYQEIESYLDEMSANGNIPACCERLLLVVHDSGRFREARSMIGAIASKERAERAHYVEYMMKEKCYERIEKVALQGVVAAQYLLAVLYKIKGEEASLPSKMITEYEQAIKWCGSISSSLFDMNRVIGELSLMLSALYKLQNDEIKAMEAVQRAVKCNVDGAEDKLISLRMASSSATQEDINAGVNMLSQNFLKYDAKFLRGSVVNIAFGAKTQKGFLIKKNPIKGYEIAAKILSEVPQDPVALYVAGRLVYENGGEGCIPNDIGFAQAYLLKAIELGHVAQLHECVYIALTYCKNHDYSRALEWLARFPRDPRSKLLEGCVHLLEKNVSDSEEKALACFSTSLWQLKTWKATCCIDVFMRQIHEDLAEAIARKSENNVFFRFVRLRLAALFGLESVGLNESVVQDELSAVANILNIDGFMAYLYRMGIWVEKSEERSFALCKKVLDAKDMYGSDHDEAVKEMVFLSDSAVGRIGVMAKYIACLYALNDARMASLYNLDAATMRLFALRKFAQAEIDVCSFSEDEKLLSYARTSGAWDAVLAVARQGNYDAAGYLCMSYSNRTDVQMPNKQWLEEAEAIAIPLLEMVCGKTEIMSSSFGSHFYSLLACAWSKLGAEEKKCVELHKKAIQLAPNDPEVVYRFASYKASLKKEGAVVVSVTPLKKKR